MVAASVMMWLLGLLGQEGTGDGGGGVASASASGQTGEGGGVGGAEHAADMGGARRRVKVQVLQGMLLKLLLPMMMVMMGGGAAAAAAAAHQVRGHGRRQVKVGGMK